jgi:hypothetical protein
MQVKSMNLRNEEQLAALGAPNFELVSVRQDECKHRPDEVRDYYICKVAIVMRQGDFIYPEESTFVTVFYRGGDGWLADEF